ncbi:MAG: homocysteine S-methyltransferase family protein [Proteobacteria bacterium]|nr:homocysteine S-methyltransferase family protein [Pseudomonadota bacterium]
MPPVLLLDGPVGTELARRGVPTPLPLWSASAMLDAPAALASVHADYAAAGARIHTANTFRTDPYTLERVGYGDRWQELIRAAVRIARDAVPEDHLVAGSIAPLEDCYRPDLTPDLLTCRREHGRLARELARAGVDLILCETFPHAGEALAALDAALETDKPVWLSLTLGPEGTLLEPDTVVATLEEAARRGAEAILVNCSPVGTITDLLPRLASLEVEFGAYGNVGEPDPVQGWRNDGPALPIPYAEAAKRWQDAGASILGGCCGTTPEHIAELAKL